MCPKDADGMTNSVDPHQTASEQSDLGLHFAKTCLSEYLGPLRYMKHEKKYEPHHKKTCLWDLRPVKLKPACLADATS